MQLERLSLENESEILALLQDVWPRLYGATGCPQFSSDYLRWLYGGPDAERHLLLGCRIKGRLVGFKAYLSRDLLVNGQLRSASLSTHLTILPELAPDARLEVAAELSRLHPLDDAGPDNRELLLAFFECSKPLLRNVTQMAGQRRLDLVIQPFRQAVVNGRKAKAFAAENTGIILRRADPTIDYSEINDRLAIQMPANLAWAPSHAVRRHHLTQAPEAEILLADRAHASAGCLASYRMNWCKNGQITRMLIIEALAAKDTATLAALLGAVAEHAAKLGYRGVVIENPTLLHPELAASVGVVETARTMVLSVRSRGSLCLDFASFALDVK